ncbi:hypothetical protein Ancab_015161, partial [Ancistrocladus abbreviatus]
IVPDAFGQDITSDHIPGSNLQPQVAVHNSKCNPEKQVMIANTDREDRDNDESESVHVGTAELPPRSDGFHRWQWEIEKA